MLAAAPDLAPPALPYQSEAELLGRLVALVALSRVHLELYPDLYAGPSGALVRDQLEAECRVLFGGRDPTTDGHLESAERLLEQIRQGRALLDSSL